MLVEVPCSWCRERAALATPAEVAATPASAWLCHHCQEVRDAQLNAARELAAAREIASEAKLGRGTWNDNELPQKMLQD